MLLSVVLVTLKKVLYTQPISVGKYTNHKGRNRRFTNPEELEEQRKREEKERRWRVSLL